MCIFSYWRIKAVYKFDFGNFESDFFFFRYFIQRFSEKKRKLALWATPCQDEDEHFQVSFLLSFGNFCPSNAWI